MNIRNKFLEYSMPITKALGKVGVKRKITDIDYIEIKDNAFASCVFLSRKRYELSNCFIPGFYTHAAICDGNYIYEAVGDGVRKVTLPYFCFDKDYIAMLQVKNTYITEISNVLNDLDSLLGKPYDYYFTPGNESFYCSELVAYVLKKNIKSMKEFTWRETLGVATVEPMDFYKASKYFDVIWENKHAS